MHYVYYVNFYEITCSYIDYKRNECGSWINDGDVVVWACI
jgi:hypothetical protein